MLFCHNVTVVDINSGNVTILQHSSVATWSRKVVKISRYVKPHSVNQEAFKLKLRNCNIFAFSCIYVWRFHWFLWCFLCWKLTKPCHSVGIAKMVSQQKRVKHFQQTPQHFNKRLSIATEVPSAPSAIIGALMYSGIPSYHRSRPEQLHHHILTQLTRWLLRVYRVSNGRPLLQLFRKGAYVHYLWFYSEIYVQKDVILS